MKFSNLKFAQKMGLGFGLLISISIILGLLAITNMQSVSKKSKHLAHEYVPEVEVSNNIERYSLLTMYSMRGYAFTEEEQFLKDGLENLKKVKQHLAEAQKLANNSTQLVKLSEAVAQTTEAVDTYEKLAEQTVETNEALSGFRDQMDNAATVFLKSCNNYLESQNNNLDNEILKGATIEYCRNVTTKLH
ncbi:MAG: hypothetical protein HC896_16250 [Bacteroidales bacterium]|nr:hypothetical protein [Bacteroidales bacterium]